MVLVVPLLQDEAFQRIIDDPTVHNVVVSAVIIVAAIVLTRILQHLVPRYIEEPDRRFRAAKFIGRTVAFFALAAILMLWSIGEADVITLLTVIGAGLAIALREVLLSLVGWINIVLRSPYKHGDRIEINGVKGDVIDIRPFHSTMIEIGNWVSGDQSTGRIVHIPNGWIYQHGIYNYTRGFGFLWNEIPFTLTFRSDWSAARELILELASESADIVEQQVKQEIQRMSREYLIHYSILTPFVYVNVVPDGILLTLRYLCEARKRRGTEHALTVGILQAFKEHGDIELAYPMRGIATLETPQFGPFAGTRGETDPGGGESTDE